MSTFKTLIIQLILVNTLHKTRWPTTSALLIKTFLPCHDPTKIVDSIYTEVRLSKHSRNLNDNLGRKVCITRSTNYQVLQHAKTRHKDPSGRVDKDFNDFFFFFDNWELPQGSVAHGSKLGAQWGCPSILLHQNTSFCLRVRTCDMRLIHISQTALWALNQSPGAISRIFLKWSRNPTRANP